MTHFKGKFTSPARVLGVAYIYVVIVGFMLYLTGIYSHNNFFNWGPPITFFQHTITSQSTFYALHLLILFHQLVNNWVSNVVYPWIINSVQDPKNTQMEYSTVTTLILINLFDFYSELDMVFILIGFTSQISFLFTISLANTISSTYINWKYIKRKQEAWLELV